MEINKTDKIDDNRLCYCNQKQEPHKPDHSCFWDTYVVDNHPEECRQCPRSVLFGSDVRDCEEHNWTSCPYWRDYKENKYY